jgi:hypothetical protein
VASYSGTTVTTIVGAIAKKFDTSSSSTNFISGAVTPGFDLSKLEICIEVDESSIAPQTGDVIKVNAYYPFTGVSTLLFGGTIGARR